MSFKPIDPKRDEFRKYLERTSVLDTLNRVILELFETPDPRPDNAIEFLRRGFGDTMTDTDTIEQLKRKLEDSQNEVAKLERQLEAIKMETISASAKPEDVCDDESAVKEENDENASSDDIPSAVEIEAVAQEEVESNDGYTDTKNEDEEANSEALEDVQNAEAKVDENDVDGAIGNDVDKNDDDATESNDFNDAEKNDVDAAKEIQEITEVAKNSESKDA